MYIAENIDSVTIITELMNKLNCTVKTNSDYINKYGTRVPRVTEILSCAATSNEGLLKWSNSLGFKRINYSVARNEAAQKGTYAHNNIESFLNNKEYDITNYSVLSFKKWLDMIKIAHKFIVLGMEEKLVCDWFGGTYDLLCQIDNKIFLIDLKTSNHVTEKYFMQLAAYIYMIEILKGIHIDGCIILQLSKESVDFNEFYLDFDRSSDKEFIINATQCFFALVYAYYNHKRLKDKFDNMFAT